MPTKNIDLFTQRYLQIILVMMSIQALYQYMHIPHSQWLITGICSLYAGFDPGQVIKRAGLRLSGTIAGIALVTLIWHLIHWDFRLLIVLTTLMVGLMIFLRQLPYNHSVILNTAFSDISTEWSNKSSFNLDYYLTDRLICTVIVFALCIAFERLWFGRKNLSYLNYLRTQQITYTNLKKYHNLVIRNNSSAQTFKLADTLLQNVARLSSLAEDLQKEGRNTRLGQELTALINTIRLLHNKIICLSYLIDTKAKQNSIDEVAEAISQLFIQLTQQIG